MSEGQFVLFVMLSFWVLVFAIDEQLARFHQFLTECECLLRMSELTEDE